MPCKRERSDEVPQKETLRELLGTLPPLSLHMKGFALNTRASLALVMIVSALTSTAAVAQNSPQDVLRFISTDGAPKPAGPYSQGVAYGGLLYVAGQTPRDPTTGKPVTDSIEAAANRVLENVEAILKADGLDWSDVIKVNVYLTKPDDFAPLNAVYAKRLGNAKPARTTVIVAAMPNGALLGVDLIARTRK
jgi:2-iminobutanoate/2-iminopropanoate deaminase